MNTVLSTAIMTIIGIFLLHHLYNYFSHDGSIDIIDEFIEEEEEEEEKAPAVKDDDCFKTFKKLSESNS